MFDKVYQVCGACKSEFSFRGRKAWWLSLEWLENHKCEGPQLTYLFQSAEPPTYMVFDEDQE